MPQSGPGHPHYRWLVVVFLVMGGVYLWYAVNQYNRLNDLNQRQLSNAAAEVKSSIESAIETVTKFNQKMENLPRLADRAANVNDPVGEKRSDARPSSELCDFDTNQPYLDLVAGCEVVAWGRLPFVHAVTLPMLAIEASSSSDPKAEADTVNPPIAFRFRSDRVLQELAFPDNFGLIFIAAEDGTILYQEAPTRRLWLRELRWGEQTFRDGNADRPATLQIQNLKQVMGGDTTWNQLRAVSSRTTLELGGVSHQLYLQPVALESGQRRELVVGGAVPTQLIVRDALTMDTHVVGALAFVFLFCLLGFPFVKLACLDPHERFGLWDINRLYLSTGALLVLLTCAALAVDGYYRWHAVVNAGLVPLAEQVESHFRKEVGAIRDQLAEYDAQVSAETTTHWEKEPWQTEWFKQSSVLAAPQGPIFLKQVSWIAPDGQQIWKATSDTIRGRIPLDKRVYFRAVRDNNLFKLGSAEPAFFIGPDRSIADGKFYTFVSMKSALKSRGKGEGTVVVAATAQLLSLDRQPLPAGYGFAVVNREGRVLYHSDRRLSLRENFFEELSEGSRVQAFMYAGEPGHVDSGYRERPHEIYLHPIEMRLAAEPEAAGQFYVVTFRDTSVERALVGHAFVLGLAGPLLLLLSIYAAALGAIAIVAHYTSGRWSAWLWPHGGLAHIYKRQTLAFLLLLVLSVLIYVRGDSVIGFLLLPLAAPIAGLIIYARGVDATVTRHRLRVWIWQTAALVLLLVAMLIAPSSAMFRLVLSREFAKLIVTERDWVDMQKADVLRAAEVEAVTDYYRPPSGSDVRAEARQGYFNCKPAPFDAKVESTQTGTEPPSTAAVALASDSPATCAPSARLTPIHLDPAAVGFLRWVDDFLPIENVRVAGLPEQKRAVGYSPDGTLLQSVKISSVALIGFGPTLALLVWWIRWNSNRLFFADVEGGRAAPPDARLEEIWKELGEDNQMPLLQVMREGIANPYQRPMICHCLELGLLRLSPDLQPGSETVGKFLRDKEQQLSSEIEKWQHVNSQHSWRQGRLILIAVVAALGILIVATQPALQSSLLGIAGGLSGALAAALKLRDAIAAWLERRSAA